MRIIEENKPHQVARMLLNVVHNARRAVKLTYGELKGHVGDDGEVLKHMVSAINFKENKHSYALRNLNKVDLVNPVYPFHTTCGFYLCKEFHAGEGNNAYLATTANHALCVIKTLDLPPMWPSFFSELRSLFSDEEVKQVLDEAKQQAFEEGDGDDKQAEDVFYEAVRRLYARVRRKIGHGV